MHPRSRLNQRRQRQRLSWKISLASVLLPLLLVLATVIYQLWLRDDHLELIVVDRGTGQPIVGATVETPRGVLQTDRGGRVRVPRLPEGSLRIVAPDHDAVVVQVNRETRRLRVSLRSHVVHGSIVRNGDGKPIPGATVRAVRDGVTLASAVTDEAGRYLLRGVPEGAEIVVEHAEYASASMTLGAEQSVVDLALRPDVLRGVVRDPQGKPVAAIVAMSGGWTRVAEDGTFQLKGVAPGQQVFVKAPGYRATSISVPENLAVEVILEPLVVRGIYINALVASKPEALEKRLQLVDRTELNAVVIDLKDSTGHVYYDTRVALAHEIGAVRPILDPRELVNRLKTRGIYTIARIVVFEDPILAEAHPEWAIRDRITGQPWRTWNGVAWVNAYREEVWRYNVALAVEAAEFGFDEIQFDYIRFPTDGPLPRADYGVSHTAENRTTAIKNFLQTAYEALLPTQAYLAADIFGLTMWELADSGIGQNLEVVAEHVDYVCPMLYPSHFWAGSLGFDVPNDHPYEVIRWSLENGLKRVPAVKQKFRPWLQDFSYGPGKPYGQEEVRAQIRAVYDAGLDSWMLWNADSVYQEGALEPAGG